jgi:hypothetical protein
MVMINAEINELKKTQSVSIFFLQKNWTAVQKQPRFYWIRWYIESIWRVVGVNCGFDGLFF